VIAQVALSFLLLAGAGLFVKTLANLKETNSGFRGLNNLITFQVDPALNGYSVERIKTFYQQALQNLRSTPGVTAAGSASVPLLSGNEWDSSMGVEGHQVKDGEDVQAFMNAISPEYFRTMGVPLLEGRDFDDRDSGKKLTVAIVNRAFATHFFGSRSPIGRRIGFGTGPKSKLDMEIIGMVDNSLYEGPREGVHRQVFVAVGQSDFPAGAAFYVRTSMESSTMFAALRRKIAELDPSMPVYAIKTLETQLDETLSTERLIAILSAAFGVLATLLAALGLYGVLAFVVARRTKEIGLRMALGAGRGAVIWMVMREALALLGIGVAVGVPCAYLLSRYVGSQLFGVKSNDVWTAALSLAILGIVAAGAGFLPARRASAIDPIKALRYE
jgi:predicted permease